MEEVEKMIATTYVEDGLNKIERLIKIIGDFKRVAKLCMQSEWELREAYLHLRSARTCLREIQSNIEKEETIISSTK